MSVSIKSNLDKAYIASISSCIATIKKPVKLTLNQEIKIFKSI
ncbi:hypothetical protein X564_11450 [Pseudoalteromonas agarivorans]|nr:hypothetical protein X564_11450 [Pseudoalteromonas agarivorans]